MEWIDTLAHLKAKRVLDVGCGGGILAEAMAHKGAVVKGIDLADFEARARKAFGETEKGVALLKQALDASLREAIKRTGLDFDVIAGGMGKASRSAINDTDAVTEAGEMLGHQRTCDARAHDQNVAPRIVRKHGPGKRHASTPPWRTAAAQIVLNRRVCVQHPSSDLANTQK